MSDVYYRDETYCSPFPPRSGYEAVPEGREDFPFRGYGADANQAPPPARAVSPPPQDTQAPQFVHGGYEGARPSSSNEDDDDENDPADMYDDPMPRPKDPKIHGGNVPMPSGYDDAAATTVAYDLPSEPGFFKKAYKKLKNLKNWLVGLVVGISLSGGASKAADFLGDAIVWLYGTLLTVLKPVIGKENLSKVLPWILDTGSAAWNASSLWFTIYAALLLAATGGIFGVVIWAAFLGKNLKKRAVDTVRSIKSAWSTSRIFTIIFSVGFLGALSALTWKLMKPHAEKILRKLKKGKDPREYRKLTSTFAQNLVDIIIMTLSGLGVFTGSVALLHSARFFDWFVPFFERVLIRGTKPIRRFFVVKKFQEAHQLRKSLWFWNRSSYDRKLWNDLPAELRDLRMYVPTNGRVPAGIMIEGKYFLLHRKVEGRKYSIWAPNPAEFWPHILDTVDPYGDEDTYKANLLTALASAHDFTTSPTFNTTKLRLWQSVEGLDSFNSFASFIKSFRTVVMSTTVGVIIGLTIWLGYKLALRIHNARKRETFAADDIDFDDDSTIRKRKMKHSNDPAVRDLYDRLQQHDIDRLGGNRESLDLDDFIPAAWSAPLSRITTTTNLLNAVLPMVKEYLACRFTAESSGSEGDELFRSALESLVVAKPEAEIINAPRITKDFISSGPKAYTVTFRNGDAYTQGVGFFATLAGRTLFVTAAHNAPEGLTSQGVAVVGSLSLRVTPIVRSADILVCTYDTALLPDAKPFRFAKIQATPNLPVARVGPTEFSTGSCVGKPAAWTVEGVQPASVTYTSRPGDSGSPVVIASAAHNGTLIGVHACADEPNHTNGFWVLDAEFVGKLETLVKNHFEANKPIAVSKPAEKQLKKKQVTASDAIAEIATLPPNVTKAINQAVEAAMTQFRPKAETSAGDPASN